MRYSVRVQRCQRGDIGPRRAIRAKWRLAEDILNRWKRKLAATRLHTAIVHRVIHFCSRFRDGTRTIARRSSSPLAFTTCHSGERHVRLHPASDRARNGYLPEHGLERWSREVESMIAQHHELTKHDDALGESFRRSDPTDVSLGVR
jgi:hypothetical protein